MQVKIGHFAKTTTVATVSQAVTGVGFKPKALILWTAGGTVDGTIQTQATGDARAAIGMASATSAQVCCSTVFDSTDTFSARWMTQHAICLVNSTSSAGAVSVVSRADLISFDSDGFTLSWTTNSTSEAQVIHYLAMAGNDVQATVLNALGSGATASNISVTGAGFQPNVIFNIGSVTPNAFDVGTNGAGLRCGAATALTSRWGVGVLGGGNSSGPADRLHHNARVVAMTNTAGNTTISDDLVSLDLDGCTLSQTVGTSHSFNGMLLRVQIAASGILAKTTGAAPASQSVAGLGFQPKVVILASDQDINRANVPQGNGARFGFSAFTSATGESMVLGQALAPSPWAYFMLDKSGKSAVKIDNATPAIDAESTATIDTGGFTMVWNANDGVLTELGYLALGDVIPSLAARVVTYERTPRSRRRSDPNLTRIRTPRRRKPWL